MAELETESQGIEIQVDNSAQWEEELVQDPVVICIDRRLTYLLPVSVDHCIYRVHKALRQQKPQAYTPQVVSIGPLHHGKPWLEAMEEHKLRHLQIFLTRFNLSLNDCVELAREMEKRARDCYADKTSNSSYLTSAEFVNMLLVDAAFIIMLLLNNSAVSTYNFNSQQYSDYYMFYRPHLLDQVIHDIILLENQLPFFVIEQFNKLVNHPVNLSLLELTFHLFNGVYIKCDQIPKLAAFTECKHFTDFLRICLMPPHDTLYPPRDRLFRPIPNAEKLHDAGVKFKLSPSKCLVDIQFNAPQLQIPRIQLEDSAESFYRNVMAFEMYHQGIPNTYLINYMEFLNNLIQTPTDVDLLLQKGIIDNGLGDNQAVATLFNNLLKYIVVDAADSHLTNLYRELNSHCNTPKNMWRAHFHTYTWMTVLKRDYFSTPWRAASTIAAVIPCY